MEAAEERTPPARAGQPAAGRGQGTVNANNFRGIAKFHSFMTTPKKFQVPADRTILKFDALPIAHFEADVPNFSKHL